jgi:hypothetical protein
MDMPEDLSGLSDEKLDELTKKWEKEKKYYDALKSKAEAEAALNPSEMENAKTLAEQQKAIFEAQKATLKAKLPDFDVKGPEGKITADQNVNIECNILAYQALSEIVSHISEKIKKENEGMDSVVICDRNDLNNYFSYRIFQNQINLLKEQYEKIPSSKEEGVKTLIMDVRSALPFDPLTGVSTVLSSFVDFASLFRTDVDIKGITVDVVEEALIAELARYLQENQIKPIYIPFITEVSSDFLTELSDLKKYKDEADEKIEKWKDKEDEEHLTYVKVLKYLNTRYQQIETTLMAVDEKTGTSYLDKMIKGEILNTKLKTDGTRILYLKIVKMGGNNKTKSGFLRNEIAHSGGAIIAYFLMDKEGDIKQSEMLYSLSPYHRFDKSKNIKIDKSEYYTNFNI